MALATPQAPPGPCTAESENCWVFASALCKMCSMHGADCFCTHLLEELPLVGDGGGRGKGNEAAEEHHLGEHVGGRQRRQCDEGNHTLRKDSPIALRLQVRRTTGFQLGGGYRWGADGNGGPGGGAAPELLDGDGDVVPTRWARRLGGGRMQGQQQCGAVGAPVPDPAAVAAAPQLRQRRFLPFEEALAVARSLGLAGMSGVKEWKVWCKAGGCPPNVPRCP